MPSIAIVGASDDRSKFGNKALRAYQTKGYTVYPINPKGGEIEGVPAYSSLSDLPEPPDRVSFYVPPQVGIDLLEEVKATGSELWLNPGTESDELVAKAHSLGLDPIIACSILDVGVHPASLGE